jgi:tRNA G37 N-methylase TrmD
MQTYFVWVCAGRMLSQPDAKRSSVTEERVLIMGRYFVLDPQKARVFF